MCCWHYSPSKKSLNLRSISQRTLTMFNCGLFGYVFFFSRNFSFRRKNNIMKKETFFIFFFFSWTEFFLFRFSITYKRNEKDETSNSRVRVHFSRATVQSPLCCSFYCDILVSFTCSYAKKTILMHGKYAYQWGFVRDCVFAGWNIIKPDRLLMITFDDSLLRIILDYVGNFWNYLLLSSYLYWDKFYFIIFQF